MKLSVSMVIPAFLLGIMLALFLLAFTVETNPATKIFSSLTGTFVGAFLAYLSLLGKEKRETMDRRFSALRTVQMTLAVHLNKLHEQLASFSHWKERYKQECIPPQIFDDTVRSIDLDSVAFLMDTNYPWLTLKIDTAERTALTVYKLIAERERVLAKITDAEVVEKGPTDTQFRVTGVSPIDLAHIQKVTEAIFIGLELAIKRCQSTLETIGEKLGPLFPGRDFAPLAYTRDPTLVQSHLQESPEIRQV